MYDERERAYLTEQPASRTRFYRDKRNGKLFGVCSGIADYTGFDANLVRVCFLAAVFMSGGSVLPFYFIAAMVTPTKPRELESAGPEERQDGAEPEAAEERHHNAGRGEKEHDVGVVARALTPHCHSQAAG